MDILKTGSHLFEEVELQTPRSQRVYHFHPANLGKSVQTSDQGLGGRTFYTWWLCVCVCVCVCVCDAAGGGLWEEQFSSILPPFLSSALSSHTHLAGPMFPRLDSPHDSYSIIYPWLP